MHTEGKYEVKQRIYLFDGYQSRPIWEQPENRSTHYDYEIDKQCRVPIRSREELKKELGMM